MASHARLVLTDLLTALRTDLGDYDLSTVNGTPKVVVADGPEPPVGPPWVALAAPAVEPHYDGGSLDEYRVTGVLQWYACAAFTAETPESRAYAALDLASEVVARVHTAHRTSSFATLYALPKLLVVLDDVFGEGPGVPPGAGMAQGRILYEAVLSRGI